MIVENDGMARVLIQGKKGYRRNSISKFLYNFPLDSKLSVIFCSSRKFFSNEPSCSLAFAEDYFNNKVISQHAAFI